MLPKAELHVHLEGTATPDLVKRLAKRNHLELPKALFNSSDNFAWKDFLDFLKTYDLASSAICKPEDYYDVTYEYLERCAKEGAIYVEMLSVCVSLYVCFLVCVCFS